MVGVALVVAIQLGCVFMLLRRLAREDEDASRAEKLWVHAPLRGIAAWWAFLLFATFHLIATERYYEKFGFTDELFGIVWMLV